jgi:hypothetical protein
MEWPGHLGGNPNAVGRMLAELWGVVGTLIGAGALPPRRPVPTLAPSWKVPLGLLQPACAYSDGTAGGA